MKRYISEGLANYLTKDLKPWHMPGHKRKNFIDELIEEAACERAAFSGWEFNIDTILQLAASMDVTELPGLDDLHNPEDMILKSQQQLARIYGTHASYYMVNGATGGIMSAVGAVAAYGKIKDKNKIIIARNCHKSVYNACEVFGLKPIYFEPEEYNSYIYGDVKPNQIKELVVSNPDVAAVVITSPTYEGVVSNVAGIKKVLEPYNIPLIVDEAHGAHLPFIDELPVSAVALGADIVVQSLHKTLPTLTQTALMHVNNPELNQGVKKYLSIFMSSSPSYIMLCSMELAVINAWERKNSKNGYSKYLDDLKSFRQQMSNMKNIRLLDKSQQLEAVGNNVEENTFFAYDDTRIVLYSPHTGETMAQRLREIGDIEVEMSGTNYVVLISTYVDGSKEFQHLAQIIKLLDEELGNEDGSIFQENQAWGEKTFSKEELYKLVGTVATDNIYVYPPGSYIVAAGEEITQSAVDKIHRLKASGKKIVGIWRE